ERLALPKRALPLDEQAADVRQGRRTRGRVAHLRRANVIRHVLAVQLDARAQRIAAELDRGRLRKTPGVRGRERGSRAQRLQSQRAIERPGVEVAPAQPLGDRARGGALPRRGRAVDRDHEAHAPAALTGTTSAPSAASVSKNAGYDV